MLLLLLVSSTTAYAQSGGRAPRDPSQVSNQTTREEITKRGANFLASGPRSPTPGAPYTYVTTKHFLTAFGMETLRDLPDIEALEDAGLLSRKVMGVEAVEPVTDGEEE